MGKRDDLRPESPLGQRHKDLSPFFTMLRMDSHKVLAQQGSAENAINFMFDVRMNHIPPGSETREHSSFGPENPLFVSFANSNPDQEDFWGFLFLMLFKAGFVNKEEVAIATSNRINALTRNKKPLTGAEIDQFGEIAGRMLNKVYDKQT